MGRQAMRWIRLPVPVLAGALALAVVSGWARPASAQSGLGRGSGGSVPYPYGPSGGRAGVYSNANVGGTASGSGPATGMGMYGNPYSVPSMNPFLNPYAALYAPASTQNAALYFFAAQQSMGGIGSGQISGTRPRPGTGPTSTQARSPIPSDRRVSDTPGAGAARYFNRSVRGGSIPEGRYNRFGNYYSANGH